MGKKKLSDKSADVPIASMIDIVFLLIIFFVVTATIEKEIQDEAVRLAEAPHGKPAGPDPRAVTVNVHQNGSLFIGGRKISPNTFSDILTNVGSEYGTSFPVIIRGDRETQHGNIKKVMESIQETGLYRVQIQAVKEE